MCGWQSSAFSRGIRTKRQLPRESVFRRFQRPLKGRDRDGAPQGETSLLPRTGPRTLIVRAIWRLRLLTVLAQGILQACWDGVSMQASP